MILELSLEYLNHCQLIMEAIDVHVLTFVKLLKIRQDYDDSQSHEKKYLNLKSIITLFRYLDLQIYLMYYLHTYEHHQKNRNVDSQLFQRNYNS